MTQMEATTYLIDAEASMALGRELGKAIEQRAVIALLGDLGAGKTTLVQGLGEGLGIVETINSPTFTMLNEYHSGRLPLYHLDLYRFSEDPESTFGQTGLELFLAELNEIQQGKGIVVLEWANYLKQYLPEDHLVVKLNYTEDRLGRIAILFANGEQSEKILEKLPSKVISS